jgi:ribosome-associated translation inhibitor RaiA
MRRLRACAAKAMLQRRMADVHPPPLTARPLERRMQIFLNTDKNTDGSHEMSEHLQSVVKDGLGRFGDHITRVEAYLSDANSQAKAGPDEIHCKLEARLAHHEPVVVDARAATAHQAIAGAIGKLKRAVGTVVDKHDPRRAGAAPVALDEDEAPSA